MPAADVLIETSWTAMGEVIFAEIGSTVRLGALRIHQAKIRFIEVRDESLHFAESPARDEPNRKEIALTAHSDNARRDLAQNAEF